MQRYFSKELKDNGFILNSGDVYHITRVMRMTTGDNIEVVHNHTVYLCQINLDNNIQIIIKEKINSNEIVGIKKVLIIPLLKEQKMDLILQKATELGVDEIIPVIMERSVVKLDVSKEDKRIERWTRICKEASEQSKRVDIPVITKVKKLKELDNLEGLKIVCSTVEKSLNLKKILTTNINCDRINIVVGPEGGISPNEEQFLVDLGFTRVSLGNRIMRVETVPLFILSTLNYEYME